nr:uncharacterized protein LOC129283259 [Lytechinus pictus]
MSQGPPSPGVLDFFREVYSAREVDEEAVGNLASSLLMSLKVMTLRHLYLCPSARRSNKAVRMTNSAPGRTALSTGTFVARTGPFASLRPSSTNAWLKVSDPSSLKMASTILLHKAGPTEDPANFRPIALQSCLYKLFMAVLADRLTKWACENQYLSPEQKSARPCEGCFEHSFLLSAALKDCRRNQKTICIGWLDLRNAFGSIPHPCHQDRPVQSGCP